MRLASPLLLAVLAAAASAEDWPRWRGPRADDTFHAPKLPDAWPAAGLRTVWKRTIGAGYAAPVMAGDRLYVMERRTKPAEVERILCLNAADGSPVWTHEYPVAYGKLDYGNGPRAAATVHDGRVYTLGAVGHAACLDAATGKPAWFRNLVAEAGAKVPQWGFAAAPLIDGDRVILHVGAEPGGCLLALDRNTGKEVWRAAGDPAGYSTPLLIDAPSGRMLVAWTPRNILGLDPATGAVHWRVPYKVTYNVSIAGPVYRDGLLVVAGYWEGARAVRLGPKPSDAELVWSDTRHLRGFMSHPLHRDGHGYLLDRGEGVVCFEWATGKKLWDDGHRTTARGRNPHASLTWLGDGDRAIILNAAGELILARLSPSGMIEQSRTKVIDGTIWCHPAFAGNRIYIRTDGGERPTPTTELVCVALTGE